MQTRTKSITRIYIIGAVWFVVMLATALALPVPMGVIYEALDAGPAVRALATMSMAIITATAVAAFVWRKLGSLSMPAKDRVRQPQSVVSL